MTDDDEYGRTFGSIFFSSSLFGEYSLLLMTPSKALQDCEVDNSREADSLNEE